MVANTKNQNFRQPSTWPRVSVGASSLTILLLHGRHAAHVLYSPLYRLHLNRRGNTKAYQPTRFTVRRGSPVSRSACQHGCRPLLGRSAGMGRGNASPKSTKLERAHSWSTLVRHRICHQMILDISRAYHDVVKMLSGDLKEIDPLS